jgi:hypothetical protein
VLGLTLSYEHYYPYGGTAIIAGKNKTQVQQKRYRYTGKERECAGCYFVVLFRWLRCLIKADSFFGFVLDC